MPTYEYQHELESSCTRGKTFDVFQGINAKHLEQCPDCLSPVKRLISAGAGIVFKGSGWYKDLYSSPNSNSKPQESKTANDYKPADPSKAPETKTYTKGSDAKV